MKNSKKILSLLLSALLLLSVVPIVAFAAETGTWDVVIAVPETVYMTPQSAYTEKTTSVQYYVNNTISSSGVLSLDKENAKENGKFFIYSPYISSVTSVTLNGATLSDFSVTNIGDLFYDNTFTFALKNGISSSQTSTLEWVVVCRMTDGTNATFRACTVAYAPYLSPVFAAGRTKNTCGENSFGSGISWVSGIHGISTGGGYYAKNNDKNLIPLLGGPENGDGADSPDAWFSSDQQADLPAKGGWYTSKEYGYSVFKDTTLCVFERSAEGFIYVDSSRYDNLKYVPNLSTGLIVTDAEGISNNNVYGYVGLLNNASDRITTGRNWYTDSETSPSEWDAGVTIWAGDRSTGRTNSNYKLANVRLDTSVPSGWIYIRGALKTASGGDNCFAILDSYLNVIKVDKAALRDQINAYQKVCAEKNYTAATWSVYTAALKNAYAVLGNPAATSANVSSALSNLNSAADALESTITLNATFNGGTTPFTSVNVVFGPHTTATFQANTYTAERAGYNFVGWSTNRNATTQGVDVYGNAITEEVYINDFTVTPNATLYAVFQKNLVSVIHCMNATGGDRTITYPYNGTATIFNNQTAGTATPSFISNSVKDGRTFSVTGFSFDQTATTGEKSYPVEIDAAETHVYATYKYPITISFDVNGGTGSIADAVGYGNANYNATIIDNATVELPNEMPGHSSLGFAGWSTDPDAVEPDYRAGATVTDFNSDVTLYAVYKEDIVAYFHYTDSIGYSQVAESSAHFVSGGASVDIAIPEVDPVGSRYARDYDLVGWSLEPDCTSADDLVGLTGTISTIGDVDYYAVYSYQGALTYDYNGGEIDGATSSAEPDANVTEYFNHTIELRSGISVPFPAITPERDGYDFLGWADSATAAYAAYKAGDTIDFLNTKTVYAIWQLQVFEVKFINAVADTETVETVQYGRAALAPNPAAYVDNGEEGHYAFTGWDQDFSSITADLTVNAVYELEAHDEIVAGRPATCTEDGLNTITCSKCDYESTEPVEATGHDLETEFTIDIEPTCDQPGSKSIHCKNCDYQEQKEDIEPLGHEFADEFTVDAEPTCTKDGSKSRHCTRCAEVTDVEAIPASGHTMVEYSAAVDATCTASGRTAGSKCSVCGFVEAPTLIPATGHDVSDWTDTGDGYNHSSVCANCGETVKESHTLAIIRSVAPTCTTEGSTAGSYCVICGAVVNAPEAVDMIDHADNNHDGKCDMCGQEMSEVSDEEYVANEWICPLDGEDHGHNFIGFIIRFIHIIIKFVQDLFAK
ncbi:MAG: InlB B-repeat-containing protein [Clostridia bacterium]|nr:InlB B-repeat-containing protein [Clostridia bacterium]